MNFIHILMMTGKGTSLFSFGFKSQVSSSWPLELCSEVKYDICLKTSGFRTGFMSYGLVTVWCHSFDGIYCDKEDCLWDCSGQTNLDKMRCASRWRVGLHASNWLMILVSVCRRSKSGSRRAKTRMWCREMIWDCLRKMTSFGVRTLFSRRKSKS